MGSLERFLLDANVLIAISDSDHVSHNRAVIWFRENVVQFATCPITQGALVRYMLQPRTRKTIHDAKELLAQLISAKGHEFWQDSLSYLDTPTKGVIGHKQVTDAYLVALAQNNKGKLATLDRPLAALHSATAVLIP